MSSNKKHFPEDEFLELLCKEPETLYQIINEVYILKEEIELLKKENLIHAIEVKWKKNI